MSRPPSKRTISSPSSTPTLLRILNSTAFRTSLYAGNALWHFSAFYVFVFRSRGILRKYTHRTVPHTDSTRDVMAFLGAMNTSLCFLAVSRLINIWRARRKKDETSLQEAVKAQVERAEDRLALNTLAVANASQFVLDWWCKSLLGGRWALGGWDIITVLDGFFFVADLSWATLLT